MAFVIMIACSFSSLHATQYGLDYDHIFETVDQQIYTGGLHFLGFGHSFVILVLLTSMNRSLDRNSTVLYKKWRIPQ